MLFKLSVRNLRKSMHNYAIYFATLILGVAVFYVFNAMESQTVMLNVSKSTNNIIELMNNTLSVISIFVSFVLGFLIIYASDFLMKRRKKEFGIYMLLGMGKRRIAAILLIETFLIGVLSLGIGLLVGIAASQGMSAVIADMFEADMTKFAFVFSKHAFFMTIVYFLIMYMVVMLFNTLVISKTRLINLLNAHKKGERQMAKNPFICMLVFIISAAVLGSAYYNVSGNFQNIASTTSLVIQIVKGILTTFFIFWSLSGLILFFVTRCKKFYYKNLNCFTVKELASRINTTVFSGSIICLMLFITICVLSSAMSVRKAINDNINILVPMDLNLVKYCDKEEPQMEPVSQILEKTGMDTSNFKDVTELISYQGKNNTFTLADTLGEYVEINLKNLSKKDAGMMRSYFEHHTEEVVKISDYNRAAKAYGIPQYSLLEDEYMIIANYDDIGNTRNEGLKLGTEITIGGKTYRPKYKKCQDGYLHMNSNHSNSGFLVVPDSADLKDFEPYTFYYLANYKADTKKAYKKIADMVDSDTFANKLNPDNKSWSSIIINSKSHITANSIGLTAMIVFIGLYLGIIFMIASAAILALKELSEAADNKEKYDILRRIGTDEHMLFRSLFTQCALFFGLPLLLACIHSIFGIQTCCFILDTFGRSGLAWSIFVTALIILAVYGVYFLITYLCSRRIIRE